MPALILLGRPEWLAVTVAIVAAAAWMVWRSYRQTPLSARLRLACAALKVIAAALIAVSLVEPLWSGVRPVPGENLFVVLADTSRSLLIDETTSGAADSHPVTEATQNVPASKQAEISQTSRGAHLRRALSAQNGSGWQSRLAQDFDLRRYRFDARLQSVENFESLTFDGTSSELTATLRQLAERYRGRPLAGILCLTDGTSADLLKPIDTTGWPPLYPVVVARETDLRDVGIESVSVSQSPFEDAPVTIQAEIASRGLAGHEIRARLLPSGDATTEAAPLEEQTQTIDGDSARLTFRFQSRPKGQGVQFYRVEVSTADESREVTTENNHRLVTVDRGSAPHRILYVSGRPNWEFKFLNRAIAEDEQIQFAALIRIARREAKFDFRGRAGESSNPLFRGFKKGADEETERFDEPVVVRLNMKDAGELRGGFPKTAEELFAFRAIVIDDLEAAFFSRDQLTLLEQFVTERGGGLLMLGGSESFLAGEWNNTPVGRMLPVYLDRTAHASPDASYRLQLTRDGWLLPWMRLRRTESDEQERLTSMPAFRTLNAISGIKPGAMVAATVSDAAGAAHPALVVQRYGRGTTAALTIGDLWRWPLGRKDAAAPDDLSRSWRQTLRWLVADAPDRFSIKADLTGQAAGLTTLRVIARDASFHPLDNADVRVTVTPPTGEPVIMTAEPSASEAGVFTALYASNAAGGYRASVQVRDGEGREAGASETGWACDPDAEEFRTVVPHRAALEQLARQTGGEVVPLDDLDSFLTRLAKKPAPVVEEWTYPLWHQWWFFAAAVACLGGEWGLRRWKGLA